MIFRLLAPAFLATALPVLADTPAPTGLWLDESGRAGIVVAPCGDKLCGTIGWLKEPIDRKTGQPKTDLKAEDPKDRSRLLCGLKMLWDFMPDGDGHWDGGHIYDPATGNVYKSEMTIEADGTLKVRGYVGISLIGRSQIWTRPAEPLDSCAG